jgi:YD repeat-containing protein
VQAFLDKHAGNVKAVLSCFDRIILRGYLPFSHPRGLEGFLNHHDVLLKDFKAFAPAVATRLLEHGKELAAGAGAAAGGTVVRTGTEARETLPGPQAAAATGAAVVPGRVARRVRGARLPQPGRGRGSVRRPSQAGRATAAALRSGQPAAGAAARARTDRQVPAVAALPGHRQGASGDERRLALPRGRGGRLSSRLPGTAEPRFALARKCLGSRLYDGAGKLTQAGGQSYAWDANGNASTAGSQLGPDNQLKGDGTWTYSYDAQGNLIGKAGVSNGLTWAYNYDNAGQLTSATLTGAGGAVLEQASYSYDALGQRVQTSVSSNSGAALVTRMAYDAQGQLYADLNADGSVQTRYVRGPDADQWLAQVSASGAVSWLLADRQGSGDAAQPEGGSGKSAPCRAAQRNPLLSL